VGSTAAGNFVANASYFHGGQAAWKAAGTSPLAHLAIYKVYHLGRCPYRAIVDGFKAAARDGVDVISVSLSIRRKDLPAPPYYEDAVTIAAFRAVAKDIIVVSATGNRGPDRSSVRNDAPWHFTVNAGSVDRRIPATWCGKLAISWKERISCRASTSTNTSPCTAPARVTESAWV
jgi:hypothetical protein